MELWESNPITGPPHWAGGVPIYSVTNQSLALSPLPQDTCGPCLDEGQLKGGRARWWAALPEGKRSL